MTQCDTRRGHRHWLSEDAARSDGSSATSSPTFVMLQPHPRLANEMMIVHFNIRVRRVYVSERVRTFRRSEGARRKEIISYLIQTGTRGVFSVEVSFDRHLDPTARPPAVPVKGRPPPPHTSIIARRCDGDSCEKVLIIMKRIVHHAVSSLIYI